MSDAARAKADEVWADEGGRALRVVEIDAGHIRVEITEGVGQHVREGVTLGRWRWDRLVAPYAAEQTAAEAAKHADCCVDRQEMAQMTARAEAAEALVARLREVLGSWLNRLDLRVAHEEIRALLADPAVPP